MPVGAKARKTFTPGFLFRAASGISPRQRVLSPDISRILPSYIRGRVRKRNNMAKQPGIPVGDQQERPPTAANGYKGLGKDSSREGR
ncbi:MAG: hypothetical protein B5M55_07450 [Desulfococcus sp. 4484_242]|nr:MAG: hypothetical protein B5M55_07450 [Desulfococcus sp. 4484_242]